MADAALDASAILALVPEEPAAELVEGFVTCARRPGVPARRSPAVPALAETLRLLALTTDRAWLAVADAIGVRLELIR
jgi:hypothetical protein